MTVINLPAYYVISTRSRRVADAIVEHLTEVNLLPQEINFSAKQISGRYYVYATPAAKPIAHQVLDVINSAAYGFLRGWQLCNDEVPFDARK